MAAIPIYSADDFRAEFPSLAETSPLGGGGFAKVYKHRRQSSGHPVAVKVPLGWRHASVQGVSQSIAGMDEAWIA